MLDRFAFAGNPDDIVRQVEAARAAGATRVEFGTPHGNNPTEGIRLLGERVLPALGHLPVR
jgi:5,10-methylenetetrahydromethanopterin reductase